MSYLTVTSTYEFISLYRKDLLCFLYFINLQEHVHTIQYTIVHNQLRHYNIWTHTLVSRLYIHGMSCQREGKHIAVCVNLG